MNEDNLFESKNKAITRKTIIKKITFTLIIFAVFLLGRRIPLYGINYNQLSTIDMGVKPTLLALGMTPWMTTMIIWKVFSLGKNPDDIISSDASQYFRQNILMLFLSIIQAIGTLTQLGTTKYVGHETMFFFEINVMFLIVGAFFSEWLSNLIARYGLGGNSLLIVITILGNYVQEINLDIHMVYNHSKPMLVLFLIILMIMFSIITLVYFAEYKIHFIQILASKELKKYSYIPLKIIPALGMPFMYSISLLTFLQYALFFGGRYNHNLKILNVAEKTNINTTQGLMILLVIIFIISIAFSFFNIDVVQTTDKMKKSGDFIENVIPGNNTQKYLSKRILILGFIGALFNVLITVIPFMISRYFPITNINIFGIVGGTYLILLTVLIQSYEQVLTIRNKYNY